MVRLNPVENVQRVEVDAKRWAIAYRGSPSANGSSCGKRARRFLLVGEGDCVLRQGRREPITQHTSTACVILPPQLMY